MTSFGHRFQREKPGPVPVGRGELSLRKQAEGRCRAIFGGQILQSRACNHVIVKTARKTARASGFPVVLRGFSERAKAPVL